MNSPKKKKLENKSYYENKIIKVKEKIKNYLTNKYEVINFNPTPYNKDSTNEFQMDFISNCSNLRAKNYNLEQEDKFKINVIAGKMIPGIITSTASIAGLLALQLYVICQNKNYKHFMVGNMNLADNALALAVPLEISETNENTNVYSYIPNALKMLYKNISFSFQKNNIIKIILLILFFKYIFNL